MNYEIHKRKIRKTMPEHQNIEYKQGWHDEYLKWVCGFANAIGGVIYIGLDDEGNVVHLTNYDRLLENIPNKIRNAMGIICDVQLHDEKGKKYISIKVNPYSVAVSLRGRYYYRSGSTKMELTGVELNEFLLKKAGKTWDDVVEEGATVKDIDEGGAIGGAIGGVTGSLTDRQKDVFKIIKENNEVTYKAIAEKLSINESAVGEHIKALKEKGAIKRDGSTRGKWIILINI
jgi:predicted HTH transcriptional regulator